MTHPHLPSAEPPLPAVRPLPTLAVLALAVVGVLFLCGMFLLGWIPHRGRMLAAEAAAATASAARPVVEVVAARRAPAEIDLALPADVRADQSTALRARTSGYLKPLPAGIDIGARVQAGQLLAELAAPDLDADAARARAAVGQAEAALARARTDLAFQQASFKRYEGFAATGGLTAQQLEERRQQLDQAIAAQQLAEANARAATAEQQRLEALQQFERVVAPYDGVLTFRGYDAGAMIAPGDARELFRIAATGVVRARASVPQAHTAAIRAGQKAELTVRSLPGRTFAGTVARTAAAIDPATRTMPIEVDVPNADGALLPGAYGTVRLHVVRAQPPWVLPASAIAFSAEGTRLAVVDGERIRYVRVSVDTDRGAEVEIASGLDGSERIVNNPGENLTEGLAVEVRAPRTAPPAGR